VLPRPPTPDPASLPSGHVTAAVSLAVAAAVLAPARLRPLAVAAGGALSAIVGVGVVASGAHRTSDVVASGLLCIAWAAVIRAGAALADRRPAGAASGGVPWPALGAAVILWLPAVATLAAFVVAALIGTPLPEGTSDEGFYAVAWPVAATAPAAAVTTIVYLGLDPVAGLGPDSEARPSPAAAARGA